MRQKRWAIAVTGHFRDESYPAVDSACSDYQTHRNGEKVHEKITITQTKWP